MVQYGVRHKLVSTSCKRIKLPTGYLALIPRLTRKCVSKKNGRTTVTEMSNSFFLKTK